jgi:hypothetical protein
MAAMARGIETGFALDRQWHWLQGGDMERSKRPALLLVARLLEEAGLPRALIGGLALQVHLPEPRTTLDIDLAVASLDRLPRTALEAGGLRPTGRFPHSEDWVAPDGTPVQVTDDPLLAGALDRAEEVLVEGARLKVIRRADLLHAKLRAGADPARRRSKRLQDLADAQGLLEADVTLANELTAEERALLDQLPR